MTDLTCRHCGAVFESTHRFRTMTSPQGAAVPAGAPYRWWCPACRKRTAALAQSGDTLTNDVPDWRELDYLREGDRFGRLQSE